MSHNMLVGKLLIIVLCVVISFAEESEPHAEETHAEPSKIKQDAPPSVEPHNNHKGFGPKDAPNNKSHGVDKLVPDGVTGVASVQEYNFGYTDSAKKQKAPSDMPDSGVSTNLYNKTILIIFMSVLFTVYLPL